MFSVGASPYNSLDRQLFGGWTTAGLNTADFLQAAAQRMDDDRWDAVDRLLPSAGAAYQAAKWANLALKYAGDVNTRQKAKAIREAMKGFVRHKRATDPDWKKAYATALAHVRSPYHKPSLSSQSRDQLWRMFERLPYAQITNPGKLFLSMLGDAPYTGRPRGPLPNSIEDMMVSGPYTSLTSKPAYELGNAQLNIPDEIAFRGDDEGYYTGLLPAAAAAAAALRPASRAGKKK